MNDSIKHSGITPSNYRESFPLMAFDVSISRAKD
jgi:hypothetical protein